MMFEVLDRSEDHLVLPFWQATVVFTLDPARALSALIGRSPCSRVHQSKTTTKNEKP
jgi:hypothetical protein